MRIVGPRSARRWTWTAALAGGLLAFAAADVPSAAAAGDDALPAAVLRELQRARIPVEAMAVVVQEAGNAHSLLSLRAREARNPASLAKLFTTAAALDQLGPAWTWTTPVWLAGPVRDGVLEGALHLKGSGDPKLVLERVWLLLRRVQELGVREIRGDIVLDRSAFADDAASPAAFDGAANRPYNVRPDALLLNYKSVLYTFVPDAAANMARVLVEPPLAGVEVQRRVPLAAGPCGDWRSALKARFDDAARMRFDGHYAGACGEQAWPVADAQPASYNARLLEGLWREMGGRLQGTVREGPPPPGAAPTFELRSPPLLEVVREINKFSNNVMAQQLFLTLALQQDPSRPASTAAAQRVVRDWVGSRLGEPGGELVVDNGSGLSREGRASAGLLARLLQFAQAGPWAAEFASSLPILGQDGTLRRVRGVDAAGRAHLKTGSLKDVSGIAGYVLSASGRRYVLAALVDHPQAQAARPALQALVQWVMEDGALR
ncbi:MAG: D-alanyl-D-alanine carboxypeptidase/D-alanyl-D-alanine-endopeptidase [Burkholderiales bacterium]|nr:D-alanyl-D-alanine carboxypeptidase/D-alanyl-D-alanine-endopeptidase [Burkholderiales bacterium]